MKGSPVPARRLIWLVLGHVIWAAGFVILYGALSIGCEYGWDTMPLAAGLTVQRAMLVALFLATLAATLVVTYLSWRRWRTAAHAGAPVPPTPFVEWAAFLSALTSVAATVVSLGPAFVLTACH